MEPSMLGSSAARDCAARDSDCWMASSASLTRVLPSGARAMSTACFKLSCSGDWAKAVEASSKVSLTRSMGHLRGRRRAEGGGQEWLPAAGAPPGGGGLGGGEQSEAGRVQRIQKPGDHRVEQRFFRLEVVIDCSEVDAGFGGDGAERSRLDAVMGEEPFGRVEDTVFGSHTYVLIIRMN